jgi:protein-disulfide isomerase
MKRALLSCALLASCYRQRTDTETVERIVRMEQMIQQRLDAQDQAIAALQTKLDQLLDALKQPRPAAAARPQRREPDASITYSVPLGKSPVFGSPKAKVTLVMAMDFDCPYCRKAFDTVDELRKKYGTELRVVYKPYVVHQRTARLPAQATCAAHKQGKWRELAELIWRKSFDVRATDPDAFSTARITDLAKEARLDMKRYEADLAACADEVRDEHASMQKLGVSATPSFFINGRYIAGAKRTEQFSELIDEELAKAAAAIKRGVAAEHYYEQEIVAKGQATPAP